MSRVLIASVMSELRNEKAMRNMTQPGMRRPRVLVVDDSASTCLSIASALQQRGYDVDIALNGQDGFTKTLTFHPHCLILDVILPDVSGYTVCRHVRQQLGQRLPHIILISSKDAPLDQYYGLRQGADCYLPKPFTEETLLQAVWLYVAIDGRRTVAELAAMTGLETKDISQGLRVLLEEHYIELYDAAGQFVETTFDTESSWDAEAPSWLVER